ncbi:MAG TPA: acyl-CoA thioesterase [Coxiellaceae bacterium]|nr:acyl-CoA thioesterase [Coxiellaceae bacterium]
MSSSVATEDRRSLTMSLIVTPEQANLAGNMHGGHLLQFLDEVAYTCAARYCGLYVVTLSVNQVLFKKPIHVGELIMCYANINHVGHTSIEVGIKVLAENLETGNVRHTNSCYFTMVALNKNGKPTKVKPLELRNELDRRRNEEAVIRKEIAEAFAQEHRKRKL